MGFPKQANVTDEPKMPSCSLPTLHQRPRMATMRYLARLGILIALGTANCYACETPNRPVRVIMLATPNWKEPAKEIGLGSVDMYVLVGVNASGKVSGARIYKPQGADAAFNNAALNAALASEYAPELKACKPVAGHIIVHFLWQPD